MSDIIKEEWRQAASTLHTWKRGGERAVHKPLLTLLLLARAARGQSSVTTFEEIEEPLDRLLREFGPRRKSYHPELPFWHLQHDGFWVVENAAALPLKKGGRSPTKTMLLKNHAAGSVRRDMWDALQEDEKLRWELSRQILYDFWPATQHDAICQAIGLPAEAPDVRIRQRRARDPNFRQEVFRAYERRCAVCGYDGRLSDVPLALEAAHIRWHSYDGPDRVDNGLALCAFHHVSLDSGAIGISESNTLMVSCDVTGGSMIEDLLLRFAGRPLRNPQSSYPPPARPFVDWHTKQVFKAPPRLPEQEAIPTRLRVADKGETFRSE